MCVFQGLFSIGKNPLLVITALPPSRDPLIHKIRLFRHGYRSIAWPSPPDKLISPV